MDNMEPDPQRVCVECREHIAALQDSTTNLPDDHVPTRERTLAAKVVAMTVVLKRTKRRVEFLKEGDPLDEILLGLSNAIALFGASNLACERYEEKFGRGK